MEAILLPVAKELTIGAVAFAGGLLLFWVKGYFSDRHKRTEETKQELKDLQRFMLTFKDEIKNAFDRLKDKINESEKQNIREYGELRGKLDTIATAVSNYSENVSKLAGRVDDQLNMTASHIATISHMSKQIDALFKIADANKRASDCQDPNGHAD